MAVSTTEGKVEVKGSTLTSAQSAVALSHSGTASVSITDCTLKNGVNNTINSSGNSNLEFVGNTISGGNYSVYIGNLGNGEFSFVDNTFTGGASYPVYMNIACSTEDRINQVSKQNEFRGCSQVNGLVLAGTVTDERIIPTGQYATAGITVNSGGTLKINEAQLYFSSGTHFIIYGEAEILGTEENPCVLSGFNDSIYKWEGIVNRSGHMGSVRVYEGGVLNAEYTKFRDMQGYYKWYAKPYYYYTALQVNGSVSLKNCDVNANSYATTYVYYVKAIEILGKGELLLENSTVTRGGAGNEGTALAVSTTEGKVEVKGSTLTSAQSAVALSHSGTASVSIIGSTLKGNSGSVLAASGSANTTIENNTITCSAVAIKLNSYGGDFSIADNTFLNCGHYPIYLYLGDLQTGEELAKIHDNVAVGGSTFYDMVLYGTPSNDLVIPKGRYFCETITVPAGKTLTVAPGTKMLFIGSNGLSVSGTLLAEGTVAEPIVFSYSKDPAYVGENGRPIGAAYR